MIRFGAKMLLPPEWFLSFFVRWSGPFALQPNNTTRRVEYPWAFAAARLRPGMRVLEIGGGLAGFQFALDRFGCRVVNVDPGMQARGKGWPCDAATMTRLNGIFGTSVELRNTVIAEARFAENSFDRIFSLSVLEHLSPDEWHPTLSAAFDCLKPAGLLVLTLDLFLDVAPFTEAERNIHGRNVNVKALTEMAPFELVEGNPAELFGFDEFDAASIGRSLGRYCIGTNYPAMAQCLVLRKPEPSH